MKSRLLVRLNVTTTTTSRPAGRPSPARAAKHLQMELPHAEKGPMQVRVETGERQLREARHSRMPTAAERATSFNRQLRVTAVAIGGASADGLPYGFLCECGCGETVTLSLAENDLQGGAWLEGHRF